MGRSQSTDAVAQPAAPSQLAGQTGCTKSGADWPNAHAGQCKSCVTEGSRTDQEQGPPPHRNCGVSSGAPPVRSSVPTLPPFAVQLAASSCTQRSASSLLIISVRLRGQQGMQARPIGNLAGEQHRWTMCHQEGLQGGICHAACCPRQPWHARGHASPGSTLAICPHMGDDSTWQCRQAWLQYSPMLSCRMAAGPRTSGLQPAACSSRQQGAALRWGGGRLWRPWYSCQRRGERRGATPGSRCATWLTWRASRGLAPMVHVCGNSVASRCSLTARPPPPRLAP